jgi:carbon storage regulator
MLVLSRQRDETIMIGDDIEITIVDIRGDKVRLGITAPATIPVHRKEVYDAIQRENREAARMKTEDIGNLPRAGRPSVPPGLHRSVTPPRPAVPPTPASPPAQQNPPGGPESGTSSGSSAAQTPPAAPPPSPNGSGGAPTAAAPARVPVVRPGGIGNAGSRGAAPGNGAGGMAAHPAVRAAMPPAMSAGRNNSAGSITA